MKTIELFEWEKGTAKSTFSDSELRTLKKFNDCIRRKEKSDAITVTYGRIFTYSHVGIIQIGKKRIEILPKLYNPDLQKSDKNPDEQVQKNLKTIARKNLFHLLSVAGLIPFYKSGVSPYGKEKDFFEFLISLFLQDLENVMGSHFHHEYIQRSDDIGTIKGKLNYQKQVVKLPSQLHTFSCQFDEFSIDNPLNRIIKATLKKIQELCRNEENKKRAFNFYALMSEIQDEVISPSSISGLHFSRLNEKYENIVEFCHMILFGSTYSADEGAQHYYALVFDMNLVFERFVVKLLRTSLPEYVFNCQNEINLASDPLGLNEFRRNIKKIIPDIIVKRDKESLAIIDTKYKPDFSKGYISSADTFQMMAYCVANESDTAILLYPKIPGYDEQPGREHWIPLDKLQKDRKSDRTVRICAKTIQMFNSQGGILKKMDPKDSEDLTGLLS